MGDFEQWLKNQRVSIIGKMPVSGGDTAYSERVLLSDGRSLFVKTMLEPISDIFMAEAAGLTALSDSGVLSVPEVIYVDHQVLVLEYLEPVQQCSNYQGLLGRSLGLLHRQEKTSFGFEIDTYCGATRQLNTPNSDGYDFYINCRYLFLAEICLARGLLDIKDVRALETICRRLPDLIPQQGPALLHGDLWSGNIYQDKAGKPVLIDPAVYWGWPEADIAMTHLFGGFSVAFYDSYEQTNPLENGWRGRVDLYNLWHLLNHLVLFGEGYRENVVSVIKRYL